MPCNVSGFVAKYLASGTLNTTVYDNAVVYLQPSRTDFQVLVGSDWVAWEGDPDLEQTYPGAISATVNSSGQWTFAVPYTDTECVLPTSAPSPALEWQIIDPNPQSGIVYYRGKTDFAIVGVSQTIKDLISLPSPNYWTVSGTAYNGYPVGTERRSTAAFTSGAATASATWPSIGSTAWKCETGIRSDDLTNVFKVTIDETSKTDVGATVNIDPPPAAGKTVYVDMRVSL